MTKIQNVRERIDFQLVTRKLFVCSPARVAPSAGIHRPITGRSPKTSTSAPCSSAQSVSTTGRQRTIHVFRLLSQRKKIRRRRLEPVLASTSRLPAGISGDLLKGEAAQGESAEEEGAEGYDPQSSRSAVGRLILRRGSPTVQIVRHRPQENSVIT